MPETDMLTSVAKVGVGMYSPVWAFLTSRLPLFALDNASVLAAFATVDVSISVRMTIDKHAAMVSPTLMVVSKPLKLSFII